MSHEGGAEQPQRTVAELLAKYGAESGERAPRRRRRRADDVSDTGAQAIIERVTEPAVNPIGGVKHAAEPHQSDDNRQQCSKWRVRENETVDDRRTNEERGPEQRRADH